MLYTDELRLQIENRFGKKIVSKTDAEKLKSLILMNQKEYLSESTIRRFFNLVKSGITSQTTLDIFSRYIGFCAYTDFCDFCDYQIKNVVNWEVDNVIITTIATKKSLSIFEVNLLTNRIVQLIKINDVQRLEIYFNNVFLFELIKANQSTADLFAQTLGPYFSSGFNTLAMDKIMNTQFFSLLILNHYVDVGNDDFEPFYKWLFLHEKTLEEKVFSGSILSLNHILKDQWEDAEFYYEKIKKTEIQMSSELAGRIALIDWIFNDNIDYLIKKAQKYSDQIIYFSLDIIPYFIFKNRLDLLKIWFIHFPTILRQNKSWVEKDIVKIIDIARCLTSDNMLECKKIIEDQSELLNSNTFFSIAIQSIKKLYFNNL